MPPLPQVRQQLQPLDWARVLHFRNFEPGAFGGFDNDPRETQLADEFLTVMAWEQKWCCRCSCLPA